MRSSDTRTHDRTLDQRYNQLVITVRISKFFFRKSGVIPARISIIMTGETPTEFLDKSHEELSENLLEESNPYPEQMSV